MKLFLLWGFIFLLTGCGKDSSKISSDSSNLYNTFYKNSFCEKSDLKSNYLIQDNFLNIFKCLNFDKSYPNLFKKFYEMDNKKWDYLFSHFNHSFFSKEKNKVFFSFLNDLKRKDRIDAFKTHLYAYTQEVDFKKIIPFVLKLKKENKDKDFYNLSDLQELNELYLDFIHPVLAAQINHQQLSDEEVLNRTLSFIDLSLNVIKDSPRESLEKLTLFFSGVDKDWVLEHFLKSETSDSFQVFNFSYEKVYETKKIMSSLISLLGREVLTCKNGESSISLNIKNEVVKKIEEGMNSSYEEYLHLLLDLSQKYIFLREVCYKDINFLKELSSIEEAFSYLYDFVKIKSNFYFFKNLAFSTTLGDAQSFNSLFTFLKSDLMEELTFFSHDILTYDFNLYEAIFLSYRQNPDFFKKLPREVNKLKSKEEVFYHNFINIWLSEDVAVKKEIIRFFLLPLLKGEEKADLPYLIFGYIFKNLDDGLTSAQENDLWEFLEELLADDAFYADFKRFILDGSITHFFDLVTYNKNIPLKKIEKAKVFKKDEYSTSSIFESNCIADILSSATNLNPFDNVVTSVPRSCFKKDGSFISKIFYISSYVDEMMIKFSPIDLFKEGIFSSNFLKGHASLFLTKSIELNSSNNNIQDALLNLEPILQKLDEGEDLKIFINTLSKTFAAANVNSLFHFDRDSQTKLLKNLFDETESSSFFKELVRKFLDPKSALKLDLLVSFIYDLGSPETNQDLLLYDHEKGERRIYHLNLLSRLEMLLSETDFAHRYYAAYFVNNLGISKNYKNEILKMKKKLKWMGRFSAFFIKRSFIEKDDLNNLFNINALLDSLLEIEKKDKHYSDLLLEIFSLIRDSSTSETKNLSLFNKPTKNVENGHKVNILISLAHHHFFSSALNVLKKSFGEDYNLFRADSFNKDFIKSINDLLSELVPSFELNNRGEDFNWGEILKSIIPSMVSELKNSKIQSQFLTKNHLTHLFTLLTKVKLSGIDFKMRDQKTFIKILVNYQKYILENNLHNGDYFYQFIKTLLMKVKDDNSLLSTIMEILLSEKGETLQDFLFELSSNIVISP